MKGASRALLLSVLRSQIGHRIIRRGCVVARRQGSCPTSEEALIDFANGHPTHKGRGNPEETIGGARPRHLRTSRSLLFFGSPLAPGMEGLRRNWSRMASPLLMECRGSTRGRHQSQGRLQPRRLLPRNTGKCGDLRRAGANQHAAQGFIAARLITPSLTCRQLNYPSTLGRARRQSFGRIESLRCRRLYHQ